MDRNQPLLFPKNQPGEASGTTDQRFSTARCSKACLKHPCAKLFGAHTATLLKLTDTHLTFQSGKSTFLGQLTTA
jgi:hypothetical protein